jgi:hypothetical protein
MGVSDRIMNNDCKAIYNPAERLEQDEEREVAAHIGGPAVEAGLEAIPPINVGLVPQETINERWDGLKNHEEHARLYRALLERFH